MYISRSFIDNIELFRTCAEKFHNINLFFEWWKFMSDFECILLFQLSYAKYLCALWLSEKYRSQHARFVNYFALVQKFAAWAEFSHSYEMTWASFFACEIEYYFEEND